jgi:ribosomal protein S27E
MAVEAQGCPQCGSAVHFKKGQTSVICDYCGTTVTRSAQSDIPLKKEMEEVFFDAEFFRFGADIGQRGLSGVDTARALMQAPASSRCAWRALPVS